MRVLPLKFFSSPSRITCMDKTPWHILEMYTWPASFSVVILSASILLESILHQPGFIFCSTKNEVHFPLLPLLDTTMISPFKLDNVWLSTGFPHRNKTRRLGLPGCFRMARNRSLLMTFKEERFHNTGSRCFYKVGPGSSYTWGEINPTNGLFKKCVTF